MEVDKDPWSAEPRDLMQLVTRASFALGRGMTTMEEASYFAGVATAKLEGKQPPFTAGQKVRVRSGTTAREYSDDHHAGSISSTRVWTVERVYYGSLGDFGLRFAEDLERRRIGAHAHVWSAADFEKVD